MPREKRLRDEPSPYYKSKEEHSYPKLYLFLEFNECMQFEFCIRDAKLDKDKTEFRDFLKAQCTGLGLQYDRVVGELSRAMVVENCTFKIRNSVKTSKLVERALHHFQTAGFLTKQEYKEELQQFQNNWQQNLLQQNLSVIELNNLFHQFLQEELGEYWLKVENRASWRGKPALSETRLASFTKVTNAVAENPDSQDVAIIKARLARMFELVEKEIVIIKSHHKVEGFFGGRFTNSNLAQHLTKALTRMDKVLGSSAKYAEFRRAAAQVAPQQKNGELQFEELGRKVGMTTTKE